MRNDTTNRLWIISELFPPEETSTGYIMGEIAKIMSSKYNVGVICGPEVYDKNKPAESDSISHIDRLCNISRVKGFQENKQHKLSRVIKFLVISWRLYRVARKRIKEGDKVLMVTNPFPLILLMSRLRMRRNFQLSLLVHDIAPEGLFTDIQIPKFIYSVMNRLFNRAYSRTDQLIAIGRDMVEVLNDKCCRVSVPPKISIVENWSEVEKIYPQWNDNQIEKIAVQYAGNIGYAQGVDEFVDIISLSQCENIVFQIWGTGSAEQYIKDKVDKLNLNDIISFHGPYSRSQQLEVLNSCDIALVSLVKGMYGLGVPSKTYNILAAGKPILYIGERNTEIWRLIEENHNGFCFEPSDLKGVSNLLSSFTTESRILLREMGDRSRMIAETRYAKNLILNKYLTIL